MTRTFSGTYPKLVKSSSNPGHNLWLACTSPLPSSITCEVSSVGSSPDVITVFENGTLQTPGTIDINDQTHRLKRPRFNVIGVYI